MDTRRTVEEEEDSSNYSTSLKPYGPAEPNLGRRFGDKVKAHSRHAAIGTLLIYADEHDRQGTQRALPDSTRAQQPDSSKE